MTAVDALARGEAAQVRGDAAVVKGGPVRAPAPPLRRGLGAAGKYAALAIGATLMVLPFADMFVGALRGPADVFANPPRYFPADPNWGIYARVFRELPMGLWLLNSVIVTGAIAVCQLVTSTMAGYALAKYRFRGQGPIFRLVMAAQMFPFFLLIIPTFFILRFAPFAGGNGWDGQGGSGLLGTYAALVLPFAVTWYGIFMMRQFFLTVPDDLIEAARIDGASEWRIFRSIMLPLVRPAVATLGLFVFVYHWNEFIWTMTVTRAAPQLQTLPVGIFLLEDMFDELDTRALQQAALGVSILPVLIAFACLQRLYRGTDASVGIR